MNLKNCYAHTFCISFEVFPPKTEKGKENLFKELDQLSVFKPAFISVTYGAGGSTRNKTLDLALEIKNRYNVEPLIHFTCVGASKNDVKIYLDKIQELGLRNILALRGDPPAGEKNFTPAKDGFAFANQLVEYINDLHNFNIAVAGYPEGHIESPDLETDVEHLKQKVDAGADVIITQLFFDNEYFYAFMNKARKTGITIPIIPGILPVTSMQQIQKSIELCGAQIPQKLLNQLEKSSSPDEMAAIGMEYTQNQCKELYSWGVPGFHFYLLNKATPTKKIIESFPI